MDFRISVIIPVYNGARYLGEAIESVLAQTRPPDEVVVVDDGSTDDSALVAQRYPVRLMQQTNLGASVARNHGVEAAQGDLLAFLDADDLWLPGKLEQQLTWLDEQPDLDVVFGRVEQFIEPEWDDLSRYMLCDTWAQMDGLHSGTMLIRRAAFLRVGPFSPHLQVAHFIEWYARAQEMGLHQAMLPEIVMKRRIHGQNMGIRQRALARTEYLQIIQSVVLRRRTAKG